MAKSESPMAGEIVPADDDDGDGVDEVDSSPVKSTPSNPASPGRKNAGPGFFTIYKRGQGKWTRLGTIFAAAGLGALTAYNLYHQYLGPRIANKEVVLAICLAFLVGFGLLVFWLSNKPTNVDFLIATDSEMKKVNWTTKGELLGSTRTVVLFLIFIGLFLFAVDRFFYAFFHLIGVLQ